MQRNLMRPQLRRVGLFLRAPQPRGDLSLAENADRLSRLVARVQLYRPVPGLGRVPAPMLHLPGYQATPERWAPLCSGGGGPYGRPVWIRRDRPAPLKECPACARCARTAPGSRGRVATTARASDEENDGPSTAPR